ncbi:MAG TPA: hypothetical protein VIF09_00960 [Polyangiaceae bacterium]|jgi:hypothetical protein
MPAETPKIEPTDRDDEALDDLPPMDGDGSDEGAPEAGPDDLPGDDPANAGLDDSTGEGDPVDDEELDVEEGQGGWLEEPADNPELELGDMAVDEVAAEGSAADDAEEPGVQGEDFGLGSGAEHGDLDGGDEGPVDPDEELREEDLPDLDADDEGEVDDASLVDAAFAPEEAGLPWAAEPWVRVGAPVPLASATAVACADRGALVAGVGDAAEPTLVRVDLEGTAQAATPAGLDVARVRSLAVRGRQVAALVDGAVLLSLDGGTSFEELAWARGDFEGSEIAWTGERLWVRSRHGALRSGTALAVSPEGGVRAGDPSAVVALAGDRGESVVALVADDAAKVKSVLRAGREAGDAVVREVVGPTEPHGQPPILAARGAHLAYVGRRGVVRRLAGGEWTRHAWEGLVTALAFVDDAGTLVAATYSQGDDTTALVSLDPATSAVRVVARIGPSHGQEIAEDGGDGRVAALAYDDARMVLWVAGGFGVAAYAVR